MLLNVLPKPGIFGKLQTPQKSFVFFFQISKPLDASSIMVIFGNVLKRLFFNKISRNNLHVLIYLCINHAMNY